jgi:rod shape determining protein RodA
VSLLVISSNDPLYDSESMGDHFLTPKVASQIRWFSLGIGIFLFCAAFDYNKLREWAWLVYAVAIALLIGVLMTASVQRVHRWFQIPGLGISLQPGEIAKLAVVLALAWFLERRQPVSEAWSTAFWCLVIVGVPFLLILKQPDLGTALVLCPIGLAMFYFGGVRSSILRLLCGFAIATLLFVLAIFLGILSHEEMRPWATHFFREYQYARLDPNTYHQKAAVTAIALGGLTGSGWRDSTYTGNGWLPAAHTDSVFPAFGEEFGLIGMLIVLGLYYSLIYFSFQVTVVAKDLFGRLLSAGVTVYLAMHILVNIGMMCGLLPITGVPLILISYGGSSVLTTLAALGILQSIYIRRFTF